LRKFVSIFPEFNLVASSALATCNNMLTTVATFLAALAVSPVAAQWNCGGNQFSPESVQFSDQCSQAVQACVTQFSANASQVNCQDSVGDLFMQQQASGGNNSYSSTAFKDILDFCLSDGWTTGTWYQDGQWYWMATEWACYNVSMPTIPADPTTPVQQRIAFSSEKGEFEDLKASYINLLDIISVISRTMLTV
jgi:hypothetical protein